MANVWDAGFGLVLRFGAEGFRLQNLGVRVLWGSEFGSFVTRLVQLFLLAGLASELSHIQEYLQINCSFRFRVTLGFRSNKFPLLGSSKSGLWYSWATRIFNVHQGMLSQTSCQVPQL